MSEIIQALGLGAGFLLPVLIVALIATIAAVNRGDVHAGEPVHDHSPAGADTDASPRARLPFLPDRDPTVLEILVLGVILFTAVMGGLLGMSLLGQLN